MIPLGIGTLLALAALAFVLAPIFADPARAGAPQGRRSSDTRKGRVREGSAIVALREIEFDRATGKLSDHDYNVLTARYTQNALDELRATRSGNASPNSAEAALSLDRTAMPVCGTCGPRPEADAIYCSECGRYLPGRCAQCGATVDDTGARYCAGCGGALAA